MNYNDFIETIRIRALKAAGDEGEVIINRVVKNNDTELDGLIIKRKKIILYHLPFILIITMTSIVAVAVLMTL